MEMEMWLPVGHSKFTETFFALGKISSVSTFRTSRKEGGWLVVLKSASRPIERSMRREITIMNQVNNGPHIISFHGVEIDGPFERAEFEWCPTKLIDRLRPEHHGLNFVTVWRYFHAMAEGLEWIHSKGIIHRDLTPSHIFFDRNDLLEIGGFGLAVSSKATDLEGQTFSAVNTLPDISSNAPCKALAPILYRPPEALLGKKYTWDYDLWSLGCILAEMLTTEGPYLLSDLLEAIEVNPATYKSQFAFFASQKVGVGADLAKQLCSGSVPSRIIHPAGPRGIDRLGLLHRCEENGQGQSIIWGTLQRDPSLRLSAARLKILAKDAQEYEQYRPKYDLIFDRTSSQLKETLTGWPPVEEAAADQAGEVEAHAEPEENPAY